MPRTTAGILSDHVAGSRGSPLTKPVVTLRKMYPFQQLLAYRYEMAAGLAHHEAPPLVVVSGRFWLFWGFSYLIICHGILVRILWDTMHLAMSVPTIVSMCVQVFNGIRRLMSSMPPCQCPLSLVNCCFCGVLGSEQGRHLTLYEAFASRIRWSSGVTWTLLPWFGMHLLFWRERSRACPGDWTTCPARLYEG